jgi:hypothetical protein
MTLSEVVHKFNATRAGDGYKAHCPAHEDRKESLSISRHHDKILLKCFAGCDIKSVLAAVGLTLQDLFENSKPKTHIVATYEYRDAAGTVCYRKQRTNTKEFWFEQPDGRGGWLAHAKGLTRHIYRRNEIVGKIALFIVEGEKDADRLATLNMPATTNDTGAGKWTNYHTAQIPDAADVWIFEDNDEAGRKHVRLAAQSCAAAGKCVRIVTFRDLPEHGDVSDWLDAGHTLDELLALCEATPLYVPPTEPSVEESPESETEPAESAPYVFEHAFPAGHFVTAWIEHFSKQCDAALEYHEGASLVALAQATPSLTARISGAADGLRTNLYALFLGVAGSTRKSTAKDYAVRIVKQALPNRLLPEQMTQESFVESLTLCNGGSALWAIDEFTDMLSKIVNSTYLAGMRGLLLELYARTDYTYRRVSKKIKKKKDDGDIEREEDAFLISNVTLSLIGCATPTIFKHLDSTAVGSGLLTRFAIVMPKSKPARLPQYELIEDAIPSVLVKWLHDISVRTAKQAVVFAPGVLQQIDEAIDKPLDESADRCQMTVRMGVMARKVAMLSAAGRPHLESALESQHVVVSMEDAMSAIQVVTRWIGYAKAFEARIEETAFETEVTKCIDIIRGRTLNRRVIAQRVHVRAKELLEIEKTLVFRDLIEVIEHRPATGRPSTSWKWVA